MRDISSAATSTVAPAAPAASSHALRIASSWASSLAWSWLRAMPSSTTRSGTTLRASPPVTVPMLATVSSSILPSGIEAIARAATWTALMPFSGSTPAWALRPRNVIVR